MNHADEIFVEEFLKKYEVLMEALGNEVKHDLYQNN